MEALGLVAVGFVTMARPLVSVFTPEAGVVVVAARAPRVISYGYIFYAWGMVTVQAFNGAGDTWTQTAISLGTNWALQMPLAWVLAFPLGFGPGGVFWAVAIAAPVFAVVAVTMFRRGGWKRQVV